MLVPTVVIAVVFLMMEAHVYAVSEGLQRLEEAWMNRPAYIAVLVLAVVAGVVMLVLRKTVLRVEDIDVRG